MTFPVWMLLAFAVWTMGVLLFTIGIYRWSRILTGRAQIKEFRGDSGDAEGWYLRAMRAHANCVENLPIFGAVVLHSTLAVFPARQLIYWLVSFLSPASLKQ